MSAQAELLGRITRELDEAGIPYMIVGSLASSFHGEPRQTRDIDMVIDPSDADVLQQFVGRLPPDTFYADAGAAAEAYARRASFNVIEAATGWKVDLIVRGDRAFSREELGRRIRVRLLDTDVYIATAEDTIIAKLEWARLGESDRQLRDVAAILEAQADELDSEYLHRWIRDVGVQDVWERAKQMADPS